MRGKDREIASRDQEIAQQRGRVQQLRDEIEVTNSVSNIHRRACLLF